jgi:hypothetical protein
MVVQFIFSPLVQQYRKIYSPEILDDTNLMKKAGVDIKQAFAKSMPADKAILAMVCGILPEPRKQQEHKITAIVPSMLFEKENSEEVAAIYKSIC